MKNRKEEITLMYGKDGQMMRLIIERNKQSVPESEKISSDVFTELPDVLRTRYVYTLNSNEPIEIAGKSFYIVDFKPRPGIEDDINERIDHIINRVSGKLYIRTDNFALIRFEAWLPSEFGVGLSYVKIYSANLIFEQEEVEGITFEKIMTINARYRKGWFSDKIRRSQVYTFFDRERIN